MAGCLLPTMRRSLVWFPTILYATHVSIDSCSAVYIFFAKIWVPISFPPTNIGCNRGPNRILSEPKFRLLIFPKTDRSFRLASNPHALMHETTGNVTCSMSFSHAFSASHLSWHKCSAQWSFRSSRKWGCSSTTVTNTSYSQPYIHFSL